MKKFIIGILNKVFTRIASISIEEQRKIYDRLEKIHISIGISQAEANKGKKSDRVSDYGFCVFSQWDEDGIIQYLISRIPEISKSFIEFGVENYTESNTRFLITKEHWRGLIIDGNREHIDSIKRSELYWKSELIAEHAFVTIDNVESIFEKHQFVGDLGILSIDIDGNDYWVMKQISIVKPSILIVEINNLLGINKSLTVPYDPNFIRHQKHFSGLYFGASLKAFFDLAKERGYSFVGCNKIGNNAFFVQNRFADRFKILTLEEGYSYNWVRESRNREGELTFLDGRSERLELIGDAEFFDLVTGKIIKINDYINVL